MKIKMHKRRLRFVPEPIPTSLDKVLLAAKQSQDLAIAWRQTDPVSCRDSCGVEKEEEEEKEEGEGEEVEEEEGRWSRRADKLRRRDGALRGVTRRAVRLMERGTQRAGWKYGRDCRRLIQVTGSAGRRRLATAVVQHFAWEGNTSGCVPEQWGGGRRRTLTGPGFRSLLSERRPFND